MGESAAAAILGSLRYKIRIVTQPVDGNAKKPSGAGWVLLLLLAALPAAADPLPTDPMPMERTDPTHLRTRDRSVTPVPVIPPRPRFVRAQPVYSLPERVTAFASYDRTLSHLCQRGAFGQQTDGHYWARTPDKRFGVAFSGGANLVDPQNRRRPGKVYFFDGQDSRCRVYVGDQAALMKHYIGP